MGSSSSSTISTLRTVTVDTAGCLSPERTKQILRIAASGDNEAVKKSIAAGLLTSECDGFDRGQRVYFEDVEILGGITKMRAQGSAVATGFRAILSKSETERCRTLEGGERGNSPKLGEFGFGWPGTALDRAK